MGLTIHYQLHSSAATLQNAQSTVVKMRKLALEMPFDTVDAAIIDLEGHQCDFQARRAELQGPNQTSEQAALFGHLIQASRSIPCPWNRDRIHLRVIPTHVLGFAVDPGPGCEPLHLGLCQYPAAIAVPYRPQDDARFEATLRDGSSTTWEFSYTKWQRWSQRNGHPAYGDPERAEERLVPTKCTGWTWSSFCKTQYASDPDCGGIANFLRCHIGTITLLEQCSKLRWVRVRINDEGRYGPSYFTDDPAVEKPVYRWHRGRYSPLELARQVGSWNELMATLVGSFQGVAGNTGMGLEAPILNFTDRAPLEFRGSKRRKVQAFLRAMRQAADQPPSAG